MLRWRLTFNLCTIRILFDLHFSICYLGERLLTSAVSFVNGSMYCSKNNDSGIYAHYCTVGVNETLCTDYFNEQVTKVIPGIPGLASGVINCK